VQKRGDSTSYYLSVALDFLASVMDQFGMVKFGLTITKMPEDTLMLYKRKAKTEVANADQVPEDDSQSLETLVLQVIALAHEIALKPQTYINLLRLVRKVIPNEKIITQKQFLIDEIVEIAKDKVKAFDNKLHAFISCKGDGLEIGHLDENLLEALADTLMTCAAYCDEGVSEDSLYVLIASGFE